MKRSYTPGQIIQHSGQAELRGPRGGHTGREVTVVEGERTPPTPQPKMSYYLKDLTHHKSR